MEELKDKKNRLKFCLENFKKNWLSGGGKPSLVDNTHLLIMLAFKEPAITVTMNVAWDGLEIL